MKDAQASFADELLSRVRAEADPEAAIAGRVLQGVEHRVGDLGPIERGSGLEGAAPLLPESGPVPRHVSVRSRGNVKARGAARARPVAAKLARWVFFGLATGGIGYLWGHATRDARAPDGLSPSPAHAAHTQGESAEGAGLHAPEPNPAVALTRPSVALDLAVTPSPAPRDVAVTRAEGSSTSKSTTRAAGKTARRSVASKGGDLALSPVRAPLSLREVLERLQHAQALLREGEPGEALRWLDELDRESPGSPLLEERLVTRTLAACDRGDLVQARQASRELERLDSESIYRGRLEASCVSTSPTRDPK